jgi:hypothetical protein
MINPQVSVPCEAGAGWPREACKCESEETQAIGEAP